MDSTDYANYFGILGDLLGLLIFLIGLAFSLIILGGYLVVFYQAGRLLWAILVIFYRYLEQFFSAK